VLSPSPSSFATPAVSSAAPAAAPESALRAVAANEANGSAEALATPIGAMSLAPFTCAAVSLDAAPVIGATSAALAKPAPQLAGAAPSLSPRSSSAAARPALATTTGAASTAPPTRPGARAAPVSAAGAEPLLARPGSSLPSAVPSSPAVISLAVISGSSATVDHAPSSPCRTRVDGGK